MKKNVIASSIFMAVAGQLTACGGGGSGTANDAPDNMDAESMAPADTDIDNPAVDDPAADMSATDTDSADDAAGQGSSENSGNSGADDNAADSDDSEASVSDDGASADEQAADNTDTDDDASGDIDEPNGAGDDDAVSTLSAVFRPVGSEQLDNSALAGEFFDQPEFELLCRVPQSYQLGTFSIEGRYVIENHALFSATRPEFNSNSAFQPGVSMAPAAGTLGNIRASRVDSYDITFEYDDSLSLNHAVEGAFEPFWRLDSNPDAVIISAFCDIYTLGATGQQQLQESASTSVTINRNTRPVVNGGDYFHAREGLYLCSLPDCDPAFAGAVSIADREADPATMTLTSTAGAGCSDDAQTLDIRVETSVAGTSVPIDLYAFNPLQSIAAELQTAAPGQPYFRRIELSVFDDLGLGGAATRSTTEYQPFDFYVCPENTQPALSNLSGARCSRRFVCL